MYSIALAVEFKVKIYYCLCFCHINKPSALAFYVQKAQHVPIDNSTQLGVEKKGREAREKLLPALFGAKAFLWKLIIDPQLVNSSSVSQPMKLKRMRPIFTRPCIH